MGLLNAGFTVNNLGTANDTAGFSFTVVMARLSLREVSVA